MYIGRSFALHKIAKTHTTPSRGKQITKWLNT